MLFQKMPILVCLCALAVVVLVAATKVIILLRAILMPMMARWNPRDTCSLRVLVGLMDTMVLLVMEHPATAMVLLVTGWAMGDTVGMVEQILVMVVMGPLVMGTQMSPVQDTAAVQQVLVEVLGMPKILLGMLLLAMVILLLGLQPVVAGQVLFQVSPRVELLHMVTKAMVMEIMEEMMDLMGAREAMVVVVGLILVVIHLVVLLVEKCKVAVAIWEEAMEMPTVIQDMEVPDGDQIKRLVTMELNRVPVMMADLVFHKQGSRRSSLGPL